MEIINAKGELLDRALKFRSKVMNETFGVESDIDTWDEIAHHICYVYDDHIVGYYRAIPYTDKNFYTESEFDLSGLNIDRNKILEIGRACVDSNFRNGSVIPALWSKVLETASEINADYVMGAASIIPTTHDVYYLKAHWLQKYDYLNNNHAMPLNSFNGTTGRIKEVPKLIEVYERVGAKIVSDPSYDPIFNTADVVTILDVNNINSRWLDKLVKK